MSALPTLTDNAMQAARDILASPSELPESCGLRVAAEDMGTQTSLGLSIVPLPAEDDEVIEEEGARVFLEPQAASLLDDKVLDVTVEENQVAFTIADQSEAS